MADTQEMVRTSPDDGWVICPCCDGEKQIPRCPNCDELGFINLEDDYT